MKIAFVAHYPELYGSNRALLALMQGLKSFGVDPLVIIPGKGPMTDKLDALGIPYSTCPFRLVFAKKPRGFDSAKRCMSNSWLSLGMARRLREEGVQAVYSNTIVIDFGFLLSQRLVVPHIWHIREFGDLDYGIRPVRGYPRLRWSLEKSSAVITISKAICFHWFGDGSTNHVHVIYDGIASMAELESRKEASVRSSRRSNGIAFIFTLVGLLQPSKGQQTAIRAMSILRREGVPAKLVLVGSGQEAFVSACKKLCADLGLVDDVAFAGYADDPLPFYFEADAGLMCSDSEGYGLVTLECMSCSRPVIGHATGATPELIRHGWNGLLYSGGAPELARCMRQLVDDRPFSQRLGHNAWLRVKQEFRLDQSIAQVFRLLESAVPAAGTGTARRTVPKTSCHAASS